MIPPPIIAMFIFSLIRTIQGSDSGSGFPIASVT